MGCSRVYSIGTTFNGSELDEVQHEQAVDRVYFAHIDHAPKKLTRADHTDWSFGDISFGASLSAPTGVSVVVTNPNQDQDNNGAAYFPQPAKYVVTAVKDETGEESVASSATASASNDLNLKKNYNTISWNAVSGASKYRVFKKENTGFFAYIGQTDETSFRDDNIIPDFADGPPIGFNPFDSAGNYPSTVTLHEQRLIFARTKNNPNAVYLSKTAEYENFDYSRPIKADDGFSFAIVHNGVNAINQMIGMNDLILLTSDNLFAMKGSNDDFLSPVPPPKQKRQSGYGASRLKPLGIDQYTFYEQDAGFGMRAANYRFEIDGVDSDEVSIFSAHLIDGFQITSWCYSQTPWSVIWASRSDGKLLAFTWQREQEVWGWTLCETDGFVHRVACVREDGEHRVYLQVDRTINGVKRRYNERMASARFESVADSCFLDCARSYNFTTDQTVIKNLWHLEGRDVVALVDGFVFEDLTVQDGQITLKRGGKKVTVGLPYQGLVETLPLVYNNDTGTVEGKLKQKGKAVVRFEETLGAQVGSSEDDEDLERVKPRNLKTSLGDAETFSGLHDVDMAPIPAADSTVLIIQNQPLPMTVTATYISEDVLDDSDD